MQHRNNWKNGSHFDKLDIFILSFLLNQDLMLFRVNVCSPHSPSFFRSGTSWFINGTFIFDVESYRDAEVDTGLECFQGCSFSGTHLSLSSSYFISETVRLFQTHLGLSGICIFIKLERKSLVIEFLCSKILQY